MSASKRWTVETPNGTILEVGTRKECERYVREYGLDPDWMYEVEVRPRKKQGRAIGAKR